MSRVGPRSLPSTPACERALLLRSKLAQQAHVGRHHAARRVFVAELDDRQARERLLTPARVHTARPAAQTATRCSTATSGLTARSISSSTSVGARWRTSGSSGGLRKVQDSGGAVEALCHTAATRPRPPAQTKIVAVLSMSTAMSAAMLCTVGQSAVCECSYLLLLMVVFMI